MIRELHRCAVAAALLWGSVAFAQDAPADPPPIEEVEEEAPLDDTLAKHRARFDVLADRTIGTATRPVEYDWRRDTVQLAISGSHLFELNTFNSMRGGVMARLPSRRLVAEFGVNYVRTWNSTSSRVLALTPFRQSGRPSRLEVDFTVGLPVAEGVVTTLPRWFPSMQMVFNTYAGVRYALYPTAFKGLNTREVGQAIFAPGLSQMEIDNLDDARLAAMAVDAGRYSVMVGVGTDLYFKQGIFLSPRVMFAIPLLAPASDSQLLFWSDFSLAVGISL